MLWSFDPHPVDTIGRLARRGFPVKEKNIDYLRRREQAERAAAKNAGCDLARRVHQELAQLYAERLREE